MGVTRKPVRHRTIGNVLVVAQSTLFPAQQELHCV